MKKLNYLLVPLIAILLIGNIFAYSGLIKQNSNIKKDISEIKSDLTKQQENLENLKDLVTFNWKEYQNDKFGFGFKYPEYVNVCDEANNSQIIGKVELSLGIRTGYNGIPDTCDTRDVPSIHITVKKNTENYKTAEEAFYKELSIDYTSPDPYYTKELQEIYASLVKNNFTYFKISGFNAYGGKIVSLKPSPDSRITRWDGYGIIILKNDYIIKFSDDAYDRIFENNRLGNKQIFDTIISSLYFNQPI